MPFLSFFCYYFCFYNARSTGPPHRLTLTPYPPTGHYTRPHQEETAQDMGKILTAVLHAFKKNGRVVKVRLWAFVRITRHSQVLLGLRGVVDVRATHPSFMPITNHTTHHTQIQATLEALTRLLRPTDDERRDVQWRRQCGEAGMCTALPVVCHLHSEGAWTARLCVGVTARLIRWIRPTTCACLYPSFLTALTPMSLYIHENTRTTPPDSRIVELALSVIGSLAMERENKRALGLKGTWSCAAHNN